MGIPNLTTREGGLVQPLIPGSQAQPPRCSGGQAIPGEAWPCVRVRFPAESPGSCRASQRTSTTMSGLGSHLVGPGQSRSSPRDLRCPRGGVLRTELGKPGADGPRSPGHDRRREASVSAGTRHPQAPKSALAPGPSRGCRPGPGMLLTNPARDDGTLRPRTARAAAWLTSRPGSAPRLQAPHKPGLGRPTGRNRN